MDKDRKFFCIEPYVGLSIIEPGKAFCCCLHEGKEVTTPDDIWNDPYLKSIRAKFDHDEIPHECKPCVEQEKHTDGRSSRRLDSNKNWETYMGKFEDYLDNDAPYKLDFWTGNICNLACATCAADDSSLWATIQKRKWPNKVIFGKNQKLFHRNINPKDYTYKQESIPNINYKNLEWVHFNGGEPLLTNTHFELLNNIPKEQRKNVILEYNTNGTIRVDINDDKWKIFQEFRSINMTFSIDGIGETFEYLRWPAKWEKVKDNVDHWVNQILAYEWNTTYYIMASFNIVKSVYNYDKIDETINYINNRWVNPIKQKHDIRGEIVYLTNDHKQIDFTNEDFENFKKTRKHEGELFQIKKFRKR